jgi:hypothetical protein
VNVANFSANAVFLYASSSIARLFGRGTGLAGTKLWLDNVELILPPQTPGSVTGLAEQCPSTSNQTYSIAPVASATIYNWTVPAGWTITSGQGTTSIVVTAGTSGQNGNITVTAGNTSGTSSAQTFAVTVGSAPSSPGAISGTAAQTPSTSNQTYSISSVSGATTYTWTVPVGWTITSGQGSASINVTTGASGQNGNVSVTAGNACGTSVAQTLAVSILNVGINEANTLKTVIVYPNPANEVLNIKIEEEIQSVVLTSIEGKVVYQGNESSVNTSALRSGLYVYEVTSVTGKVAVGNFIKQ